jgi:MoxR-like ATPase
MVSRTPACIALKANANKKAAGGALNNIGGKPTNTDQQCRSAPASCADALVTGPIAGKLLPGRRHGRVISAHLYKHLGLQRGRTFAMAAPVATKHPATTNVSATTELSDDDVSAIDRLREVYGQLRKELGKIIIGQHAVIERLSLCMFARGHALLMGVPGLAKTLLINKLSESMSLRSRIQFTPDLMPSDITGTDILEEDRATGRRELRFMRGPLFANIVLADEVNRAAEDPGRAAEAMQEQKVTVVGKTFTLEPPFFVLATQNPVEQEGTYPLPEAQLDRFMFLIEMDYPSEEEEILIARTTTGDELPTLNHILSSQQIIQHQHLVRRVPVPDHIYQFAARLVRKTRPKSSTAPAWIKPLVAWGAGPRAVQYLILGAKARAALHGSYMVRLEDILEVAVPVLTHRVITTFAAQAEGLDAKQIIGKLTSETLEQQ